MAREYGCLPSYILDNGNTLDIQIYTHTTNYRIRQQKMRSGEDITDTYSQAELEEMWQKTRR